MNSTSNCRIMLLLFVLIILSCSSQKQDWQKAKEDNAIQAYEAFIEKYPQSENVAVAQKILEQLRWEVADGEHTIPAYEKYLNQYPNSEFVDDAQSSIDKLYEERNSIFRKVHIVKLIIDTKIPEFVHLGFETNTKKLLSINGIETITEDDEDYDAAITIRANGKAIKAFYMPTGYSNVISGYHYTGARLSGELIIEFPNSQSIRRHFDCTIPPKKEIKSNYRKPFNAPFSSAYESFLSVLIELVGEMLGPNSLITALKIDYQNVIDYQIARDIIIKNGNPMVESLIRSLRNDDAFIRCVVIYALGKIGDPIAIEPLIYILKNDKDLDVIRNVINALGEYEDRRVIKPIIECLKDIPKSAKKSLLKIGKPSVSPLIESLKNNNPIIRSNVAKILGELKDSTSIDPLIIALSDGNSDVRKEAALALGKLKAKKAVLPLIEILNNDKSLWTKEYAISALGEIGDPISVKQLISVMKETDREWNNCRMEAVNALAKIKDSRAVDAIIKALKDTDFNVRYRAVLALGEIGDTRAIKPIEVLLQDENSVVIRRYAEKVLKKILRN